MGQKIFEVGPVLKNLVGTLRGLTHRHVAHLFDCVIQLSRGKIGLDYMYKYAGKGEG